jgi:hypothetical protein
MESPVGLDLAPVEFRKSLLKSVLHLLAFSIPRLNAPCPSDKYEIDVRTIYSIVQQFQRSEDVPKELFNTLVNSLYTERVTNGILLGGKSCDIEEPNDLFLILRHRLDEILKPYSFDFRSIGHEYVSCNIQTSSPSQITLDDLFQNLPKGALKKQLFIGIPKGNPEILHSPPPTWTAGDRKYILSGFIGKLFNYAYSHYSGGCTFAIGDTRLMVYTEERAARILASPSAPNANVPDLCDNTGGNEIDWDHKPLSIIFPYIPEKEYTFPFLLAMLHVHKSLKFAEANTLSKMLRRIWLNEPIDSKDVEVLDKWIVGDEKREQKANLPGYIYSKLLKMIPNTLNEDIAIQMEQRGRCPDCLDSLLHTENDSYYILDVPVDCENDLRPLTLEQAIVSAHQCPGKRSGPYVVICQKCQTQPEKRIVTDIKVYPKKLLVISISRPEGHHELQPDSASFAMCPKYRTVRCPKDNLVIDQRRYGKLVAFLERTSKCKYIFWARLSDNTWRRITSDSVSEADPTECLEDPKLGGPVLLFYSKE